MRGLDKKCLSGFAQPIWRIPGEQDIPCDADSITQIQRTGVENPDFGSVCPGKGCEAVYTPRTVNQRYCQDQQCLQEVRRWQVARRQKQRRLRPEGRKSQAAAAKDNRTNEWDTGAGIEGLFEALAAPAG